MSRKFNDDGPEPRKNNSLTLAQQKVIVDYLNQGKSLNWTSQKTGVPRSTIGDMRRRKEKILAAYYGGTKNSIKRLRGTSHPQLEQAIAYWFWQERTVGNSVSTDAIIQKAKFFHSPLCSVQTCAFTASTGWLTKFKKRNNIPTSAMMIETKNVKEAAEDFFRKTLVNKITELELRLDQIYCADEVNLYWRKLPSDTLAAIDEKTLKDKISMVACCNVTGTNRTPLQIISRQNKPLLLQTSWSQVEKVFCTNSQCYWKPLEFLKTWFEDIFVPSIRTYSEYKQIPAKALLLINSTNQMIELDTEDIKVLVIPFNLSQTCTPILQPSIISSLGTSYRKHLLHRITAKESNWVEVLMNLEVDNVKKIINESWINLSNTNIFDAWDKLLTGFEPYEICFGNDSNDSRFATDVADIIKMLRSVHEVKNDKQLLDWIHMADSPKNDYLTDEEIIECARELLKPDCTSGHEEEVAAVNDNFVDMNDFNEPLVKVEKKMTDEFIHNEIVVEQEKPVQRERKKKEKVIKEQVAWKHLDDLIQFFKHRKDDKKLAVVRQLKNEFLDELKSQTD